MLNPLLRPLGEPGLVLAVDPLGITILVAIVAGVVWLILWGRKREQQQRDATASALGLERADEDPFHLRALPFQFLGRGDRQRVGNVMWGNWQGIDVKVFDFTYYTRARDRERSTRDRQRGTRDRQQGTRTVGHTYACAITEIDADCPQVTIESGSAFSRLADEAERLLTGGAGLRYVRFDSPRFTERYAVESVDERFARELVDARMMEWLLGQESGYEFAVSGRWVLCTTRSERRDRKALLERLKGFREHISETIARRQQA